MKQLKRSLFLLVSRFANLIFEVVSVFILLSSLTRQALHIKLITIDGAAQLQCQYANN